MLFLLVLRFDLLLLLALLCLLTLKLILLSASNIICYKPLIKTNQTTLWARSCYVWQFYLMTFKPINRQYSHIWAIGWRINVAYDLITSGYNLDIITYDICLYIAVNNANPATATYIFYINSLDRNANIITSFAMSFNLWTCFT